ncbi:MAG: translation initiation factor IF-3 [Chitinivibrionales bacterium]|nr:translation initiation factor IF-3 [Chitinivibrionales bacterium]MBD3358684.1 translation initiation factor IF-3 [Chitinivibrionales bacterium]
MIRVPKVRAIDAEGNMVGVVNTQEALRMAEDAGLDLVEVAPNADPPVCRVMDYGKYKYEKSKKAKEAKKKQHIVHLKEIKLHPKTASHDYQFKMKHARDFLLKGDRVKATVVFRGREITHLEFGERLLNQLEEDLSDIAASEQRNKREGRNMVSMFVPDKAKVKQYQRKIEQERKRQEAGEKAPEEELSE